MDFSRSIMIIGAPRSGTSWVGKIFDSHPDVLYRHEPDHVLKEPGLPFLIPPDEEDRYVPIATAYAQRLLLHHSLKAGGQLPSFTKSYYSKPLAFVHETMIQGLKWLEKLSSREIAHVPVPDLFDLTAHPSLRIVVKSVGSRGRAGAFLKAMPGARFIFLLRHPCAQIASALRGDRAGKLNVDPFIDSTLSTPTMKRLGMQRKELESTPLVGQLAWQWVSLNEMALAALEGHDNTHVAVYEDLCADSVPYAQDLFAFSNLDWNSQTEDFIRRSTSYAGTERYYSVFRNAVTSANKWRAELPQDDQRIILDIVRQSRLAAFWPDIGVPAQAAVSA